MCYLVTWTPPAKGNGLTLPQVARFDEEGALAQAEAFAEKRLEEDSRNVAVWKLHAVPEITTKIVWTTHEEPQS